MGKIIRAGVDIAKSIFQTHAVNRFSEVSGKVKIIIKKVPSDAEIAMGACSSENYCRHEVKKSK